MKEIKDEVLFKEDIKYKIEDFIDFKTAKKHEFFQYCMENEEDIKRTIEKKIKNPTSKEVKNAHEILLSGYKSDSFFTKVITLKSLSNKLFELLNDINTKKINKDNVPNFEKQIRKIIDTINIIRNLLKIDHDEFDGVNNASKDFDKEISDFSTNLKNYLE